MGHSARFARRPKSDERAADRLAIETKSALGYGIRAKISAIRFEGFSAAACGDAPSFMISAQVGLHSERA